MIIFLTGKMRSGKDTVADHLTQEYGFTKLALADGVKEIAHDFFSMKEKDRELLINIGMKMREIDPEVWIKRVWKYIERIRDWKKAVSVDAFKQGSSHKVIPPRFVIPDVRLPNEWEFFQDHGGVAMEVKASKSVREKRQGYNPEFEHHHTEEALREYGTTCYVINEGPLKDLFRQVDLRMAEMGVTNHK